MQTEQPLLSRPPYLEFHFCISDSGGLNDKGLEALDMLWVILLASLGLETKTLKAGRVSREEVGVRI